ncbi:putative O-acetyl-ADP-ribose deacetylase [Blattamonas nauphoetae]|uniref:O-acetyl-ADP-ribose deacetylase n=1 Tax=Blattamonas nauphoetae TaxID=2049346 RepID=A0ABQ9XEZ2_9EUKA|nr:putative O-acetyl-ADP-ribose deacetylase [Blattamonas nauphoetae]
MDPPRNKTLIQTTLPGTAPVEISGITILSSLPVGQTELILLQGDITRLEIDAIVNAANSSLMGGGGVDGAIHSKGGSLLTAECKQLRGCETGEVKLTKGYNLPSKTVLHTVGPIIRSSRHLDPQSLTACYSNSLLLCEQFGLESVAFPCISCGVYGYPNKEAAVTAFAAVQAHLQAHPQTVLRRIIFCCFEDDNVAAYLPHFPATHFTQTFSNRKKTRFWR